MDALAGLRPDQIKTMFLELEHALLSSDDVRSQMSIVEEMTICAAYNRTFKSFVLSVRCLYNSLRIHYFEFLMNSSPLVFSRSLPQSSNLALFWKRSISSIEQREKLTIDEISLCSVLYALIAYALAGSEQLILERSNFASKACVKLHCKLCSNSLSEV
jgi:hypothetical protein